jgi:hypothetical protein
MKFSLVRPALALGVMLTLASCGGGGKATYPIHVTVYNVKYEGLVLTTNGQDLPIPVPAKADDPVTLTFPNQIEYGTVYDVVPKGATTAGTISFPKHQTCQPGTPSNVPNYYSRTGTAGLLETIDVRYICSVNTVPVGGTIKGLTGTGLQLTNGSTGAGYVATPDIDATTNQPKDIVYVLGNGSSAYGAPYGATYGVTVLAHPQGQTCTVSNAAGTIDDIKEKAGAVGNVDVNCVKNP